MRDRGRGEAQATLFRAILADLSAQADTPWPAPAESIFFGGGTPSLMDPDWTGEIVSTARRLFQPAADLEVTLEANPTDAEAGRFAAFADAGVNRLSLGVQSLDDDALAFLGRNHDAAAARRAAAVARRAFPRLSIDLIYALPTQTAAALARRPGRGADARPRTRLRLPADPRARHRLRPGGAARPLGAAAGRPGGRALRDDAGGARRGRLRRLRGLQPRPRRCGPGRGTT
ncbi:MAG: radical SAM protein [Caulobacteraceae bacterium]